MNKARPLFLVVLSLLVAIMGGLVGGSGPAVAVVSIASRSVTTIPYSGTVHGQPENVFLSGFVQATAVVVNDPDFGTPPRVVLSLDFTNVIGQGQKTGTTYVASGNQILIRPLVRTDVVDVVFPFFPRGPGGFLAAREALASFTFSYNIASRTPTGVSASTTVDVVLPQ